MLEQTALAASRESETLQQHSAAEYFLGSSRDVLLIKVNVWGRVKHPGQYNIPSGTNLIELLSAAGGPIDNARLDEVRIIRQYNNQEKIILVDIKKYLKTANQAMIPELLPGDTIIVSGSVFHLLASVVTVAYQLSFILNIYYLVSRNSR